MNQTRIPGLSRRRQSGVSLFGLMFWAVVVGFLGYVVVSVFPTVNEYLTIQRTIDKIAAGRPGTVGEARAAFDRQRQIEFSISSISAKELEITKEGDRVVIAFAYDKEIPLVGPVFLLIKYQGRSP